MYTDRPASGETVDTGVDRALSAPSVSSTHAASDRSGAASSRRSATSGSSPATASPTGAHVVGGDTTGPGAAGPGPAAAGTSDRGYLDPASTTERLRLLWSTGARDVTLVAPVDGEGHRQPGAIDPRGWIA